MGCSSSYVTAEEVAEFLCRGEGYDADSEPSLAAIERYIHKAASRINVSLSSSAQCDCTFSAWAADFLQELNLIGAVLMIFCPDCSRRLTDEQKEFYNGWLGEQLALLRTGKLDLCSGATGVEYPSIGWAEMGHTPYNEALIIYKSKQRSS